jgi:hypothetical protein
VRLDKAHLGSVSIKYRDRTIATEIESDGRYVSKEPLPTWQDYAVTVVADGFRPFVSRNPGFDVPASLAMTDGVAGAATTQTFHFDAYLFPVDLKAPKVTLTIDKSDEGVGGSTKPRASGTIRLRPTTSSSVQLASGSATPGARRWANDEDLLTQIVTKMFTEGRVEFPEGELVYGVSYQIAIFDVEGYQPQTMETLVAGMATSRTVTVSPETRDAPRIVSSNASTCTPPAGSANSYGAEIRLVFNEPIEIVGNTFNEDIDNGVSIAPVGYTGAAMPYCALKDNASSTAQERGTRVSIDGSTIILSFNPFLGINTMPVASTCMVQPMLTSVTYGNLQSVFVRPPNDLNPALRRSLGDLVTMYLTRSGVPSFSNSITCPTKI